MPPETLEAVEGLSVERRGPVLHIRLDRPGARNALTPAMYGELRRSIQAAAADCATRAVLVTASGPAFCAGNDAAGFDLVRRLPKHERPGYRFMQALTQFSKPLIAAVSGNAVGIGATMLLHFDLVYCTPDARFHFPFTRLGLVPEFASSYFLPRMAGHARAARWLLLGEPMSASEARDIGLVSAITSDDLVEADARSAAERLAALPASSVDACRALMRAPKRQCAAEIMAAEMDQLSELISSDETRARLARLKSPKQT